MYTGWLFYIMVQTVDGKLWRADVRMIVYRIVSAGFCLGLKSDARPRFPPTWSLITAAHRTALHAAIVHCYTVHALS